MYLQTKRRQVQVSHVVLSHGLGAGPRLHIPHSAFCWLDPILQLSHSSKLKALPDRVHGRSRRLRNEFPPPADPLPGSWTMVLENNPRHQESSDMKYVYSFLHYYPTSFTSTIKYTLESTGPWLISSASALV